MKIIKICITYKKENMPDGQKSLAQETEKRIKIFPARPNCSLINQNVSNCGESHTCVNKVTKDMYVLQNIGLGRNLNYCLPKHLNIKRGNWTRSRG